MWATSCQGPHSLGMKPCPRCLSLHQLGVYLRELHTNTNKLAIGSWTTWAML